MLLRFLADSSDYYDYLKGINNLTDSQKQVLYERLKSELPMTQSTPIQSLSLPTTANTTIRAALPDSDKPTYTIDCCLHCGSTVIKKIGKTKGGMQRYLCKDCHKSFTENYGLITHYSHLSEWQWQEAVRATVVGISLTELAKNINVSTKTAWLCRMKIYVLKISMVIVILLIVLLKLMESMNAFLSKVARINLSLLIN